MERTAPHFTLAVHKKMLPGAGRPAPPIQARLVPAWDFIFRWIVLILTLLGVLALVGMTAYLVHKLNHHHDKTDESCGLLETCESELAECLVQEDDIQLFMGPPGSPQIPTCDCCSRCPNNAQLPPGRRCDCCSLC